jgi:soluble lytic murein transglycosylase-like protein
MGKYLLATLLFIPTVIKADKVENPYLYSAVYKQILKVRPGIEPNYALRLAKSIYEVAGAFKIEPKLLTAILAQESMFKVDAINIKSHDYGLAQINRKTAKLYKFDLKRLQADPKYAIWAAGVVLNDFHKMYGHKEKDAWTRYNSSKPENRQRYKILVARYMK